MCSTYLRTKGGYTRAKAADRLRTLCRCAHSSSASSARVRAESLACFEVAARDALDRVPLRVQLVPHVVQAVSDRYDVLAPPVSAIVERAPVRELLRRPRPHSEGHPSVVGVDGPVPVLEDRGVRAVDLPRA